MTFSRSLVEHPDGIYIGLAHEAYLRDWAIGMSALKVLKNDAPQWWWDSPLNNIVPAKEQSDEDRRHLLLGTAAHVAMLEGMEKYEFAYGVIPSAEDFPEALAGVRQLQAKCKELGVAANGTMEDMSGRIRQVDPDVETLIHLTDLWRDSGKKGLKFSEDVAIRLLRQMAWRSADEIEMAGGECVTLRDAFEGGLSELSIFWTDEMGIRHRARLDKLKPNFTGDFKTIGRPLPDFRKSLLKEIKNRGYMYQPPHYDEARRQLPRLIAEGKVFGGTAAERTYLEECAEAETWAWLFIFGKVTGAPQIKAIRIDQHDPIYERAAQDRKEALENFLFHRELFGLEEGKIWFDSQVVWKPSDMDWPLFSDVD